MQTTYSKPPPTGDTDPRTGDAIAYAASRVPRTSFAVGYATHEVSLALKPNWYKGPILDGFERGARLYGVDIVFFNAHTTQDIETSLPVYHRRCDGLLVFGYELSFEDQRTIQDSGMPIVTVGEVGPAGSDWHVDIDNVRAMDEATTHLIDLGHQRLAILLGMQRSNSLQRRDGFLQAIRRAGVPEASATISFEWPTAESGRERGRALLSLPPDQRPTAILCFNDLVALGVMQAASDCGVRVPEELSISGVDDLVEARLARPPLTTIRQPLREIGETAVGLLVDRLAGRVVEPTVRMLPHELVVRSSTGPPPKLP